MSIRRWSNTVGVIKSNIKPFGDSWFQLITPIVFDHLIKLKELFLKSIYIRVVSSAEKHNQGRIYFFTGRITFAMLATTVARIMEDNIILTSDVSPLSPCF